MPGTVLSGVTQQPPIAVFVPSAEGESENKRVFPWLQEQISRFEELDDKQYRRLSCAWSAFFQTAVMTHGGNVSKIDQIKDLITDYPDLIDDLSVNDQNEGCISMLAFLACKGNEENEKHSDLIRFLLGKNADSSWGCGKDEKTVLHFAINARKPKIVELLLQYKGTQSEVETLVNVLDGCGRNALHHAISSWVVAAKNPKAASEAAKIVQMLLNAGVNLIQRDCEKHTPKAGLLWPNGDIPEAHLDMYRWLSFEEFKWLTSPKMVTSKAQDALFILLHDEKVVNSQYGIDKETFLHCAVKLLTSSDTQSMGKVVIRAVSTLPDINPTIDNKDGFTPLDILETYFEKGEITLADYRDAKDQLQVAQCRFSVLQTTKIEVEREPHKINQQDKNGAMYLHQAVELQSIALLQFLIDKKADPTILNNDGRTPLALLQSLRKETCADFYNKAKLLLLKHEKIVPRKSESIQTQPVNQTGNLPSADLLDGAFFYEVMGADVTEDEGFSYKEEINDSISVEMLDDETSFHAEDFDVAMSSEGRAEGTSLPGEAGLNVPAFISDHNYCLYEYSMEDDFAEDVSYQNYV